MSRSNGPVTRGGSQAQDWQHGTEGDPSGRPVGTAQHQPYQWPAAAPQQQHGYSHGAPYHSNYAAPAEPEPQYPPYHHPQDANGHWPFAAPAQHPPFFGPQPASHTNPQPFSFDRYGGDHRQEGGPYGHYNNAPAPEPQPYARPVDQYDGPGLAQLQPTGHRRTQSTLRDQLHGLQPDPWPQHQDPRDYDLGSYMPASASEPPYGSGSHAGQYEGHWHDHNSYGAHADDPQNAGYHPQFGSNTLPVAGHEHGFEDPDADDGDEDEYEEDTRSRRGLVIACALIGAIVAGGGLAYAYKIILGPAPKGEPPVIQADMRPTKLQPADPGGKQFAHSDSKLMGRLEPDSSSSDRVSGSFTAPSDGESNGVRRVSTIMVGRDGSIAPPPAEPRLPPTTISVPGMTIVDGFGGRPPMPPPAREVEPVQAASAPSVPRIISKASPAGSALAAPAVPPIAEENAPPPPVRSAAVQPVAPQPPVERAAPSRPAAPKQQQPAAAPEPKSNPVGYVAVLASQKSRIDALKTFADLQQKYSDVLHNKIPDVQEADLSARGLGTMYRVVVGPPGSREAANNLCGQLRSAGFQGCWITAY